MSNNSETQVNASRPLGPDLPITAPILVVLEGPDTGKQIALRPDTTSIGRAEDNDLALVTPHVSRHHANIIHREAQYEIEDLESCNGVILNGRKLNPRNPAALSHGDAIRMGDQVVVFLDTSGQEDSRRLSTIRFDRQRVCSEVDEMLNRTRRRLDQSE